MIQRVYIGIKNGTFLEAAIARYYQQSAYYTFMNAINTNPAVTKISFEYPDSNYPDNIIFDIINFDATVLKSNYNNYNSFCILVDNKQNEKILSNDRDLLLGFIGQRNRIMMPSGGNRTKSNRTKSNRTKSNKKISKRK